MAQAFTYNELGGFTHLHKPPSRRASRQQYARCACNECMLCKWPYMWTIAFQSRRTRVEG